MQTRIPTSEFALPHDVADSDERLDSPSFHRNGAPLVDALAPRLEASSGVALEIGSGSGQHVALFARSFPHLTFQPSDPTPAHRASTDAWRAHFSIETVRPTIDLDASATDWAITTPNDRGFCAIFSANVIHIAGWAVAEGLFRGAAATLAADGFLAVYGPFRWRGRHISDSNQAFDASLRARDPSWGVRDIDDVDGLAASHGLSRVETAEMPANNHLLFFARAD